MEKQTILSVPEMRRLLQDRNLTVVAKNAGVSRPVLYQIMSGSTDPRYSTLEKISNYLEDNHGKSEHQTS
jgi:predicted transcriptional regulator